MAAMLIDVTMPQLGESVSEGTISKWFVREGDIVKKDQPLVSIGTDKADSDLPAPVAGRVAKLLAKEGDVLPVKALLCQIEEGIAEATSTRDAPPAPPAAAQRDGDRPSRSATGGSLATPTARKAALENQVNIDDVRGSGDRGRVTRDDVLSVMVRIAPHTEPPRDMRPEPAAVPARANTASLAQMMNQSGGFVPPIPGVGYGAFKVPPYRPIDGDKVVPFTRRRRITADHMTYSKFASPQV